MVDIVIRGNVVGFSTSFFAADGTPVIPASANLAIRMAPAGGDPTIIAMSETDGVWTALWDTYGVEPGIVYWCITAQDPHASDEGQFPLEANFANVQP